MSAPEIVSVGRRLTDLAAIHPDKTALIFSPVEGEDVLVSWEELDRRSSQFARYFADRGVDEDSTVVIGLPNCIEHVISSYGAWKLGATVLPLRWDMPARELDALLELASPDLIIADRDVDGWQVARRSELRQADGYADQPLPDRLPNPGKVMASGGSTGRPKLIARTSPLGFPPGAIVKMFEPLKARSGMTSLINSPLYHEGGFSPVIWNLFEGCTIVLSARFDPENVLRLIETHRVNFVNSVPIMLQRMLEVPNIADYDLSSVFMLSHTAAPCAPWLKRAWIDLLGPERVSEVYGGTESNGFAMNNGVEWLERPGTVGKPFMAEMKIVGEDDQEVPRGGIGRIFARSLVSQEIPFKYVGADQARRTDDGFTWIGDLGWMDEDGYLYLADRRTDMIITGGANVFAAEVEGALSEHPGVADVAVVGLPDKEWGKRVHAIIEPHDIDNHVDEAELNSWCRERLSAYKCPKTYEFVANLGRTEAGKIRRSALAAERSRELASPVASDD